VDFLNHLIISLPNLLITLFEVNIRNLLFKKGVFIVMMKAHDPNFVNYLIRRKVVDSHNLNYNIMKKKIDKNIK